MYARDAKLCFSMERDVLWVRAPGAQSPSEFHFFAKISWQAEPLALNLLFVASFFKVGCRGRYILFGRGYQVVNQNIDELTTSSGKIMSTCREK
jgi:hypothetical protein